MITEMQQDIVDIASKLPGLFVSGKVTKVLGLLVEGYLPEVPVGALCHIHLNNRGDVIPAEVIGLKSDVAVLMPIGAITGIKIGNRIEPVKDQITVRVSNELLGRVINGNGDPIDNGSPITTAKEYPLYREAVSAVTRKKISQSLGLGIRAIDGFLTCGIGQRMVIMAGSGVGKSTLLGMIARNAEADVNVIGLIGERGREVREFIENDLGEEGLKKSVIVVATSDMPALVRMRSAYLATTIAEFFRDQGKKVLLMMDSLTRFAMASRQIGLSLGEPPTMKGYTPSLFSELPKLLERVGTTSKEGSITGLYTILTEGDDIQDPIADATRAIVDGHIVLDRKLATLGHYPPINVLESISRVMSHIIQEKHAKASGKVRRMLALYKEMEDYIKIGVYSPGKNPELDQAISQYSLIDEFLRQNVSESTSMEETIARLNHIAMGGSR